MKKLEEKLKSVSDSYPDFVGAVLQFAKEKPEHAAMLNEYLDENPGATSSDVIYFVSSQPDFFEDSHTPKMQFLLEGTDYEYLTADLISRLLKEGKTPKEIHDFCGYPLELILEVQKEMNLEGTAPLECGNAKIFCFQVLHWLPVGKDTVVEIKSSEEPFHINMLVWDETGKEHRILSVGMPNYRGIPRGRETVDLLIEGEFRSRYLYVKREKRMEIQIQIIYDSEAKVWVGICDKIGLALENSSVEKLLQRIAVAAPGLMKLNGIFSSEEIYEVLKEMRASYERGDYEDFDSALEGLRKKYGLTGEAQEICVEKLYELYLRLEKENDETMCAMIEQIPEFEEYVKQNDYTIWQRIHYDKMSPEELERFFMGKKSSNSDKKEMLEALEELDGCCKGFELTLEETRKRRLEEKLGDSVRKAVDMFSEDFMEDGRPEQIQDAILKKYIEEYVISDKAESVNEIMKNLDLTLEQALDALGITGDERMVVVEKYREDFGG